MEKTLAVINGLEKVGLLSRYAIGGAMGATFYVEPLVTFDLDVFVVLPTGLGGLLTLSPIYETLRSRGYTEEGECILVEGIPVQFLPAYNPLLEEALTEARETMYADVSTRVLRVEHLLAIALQTGRPKDHERIQLFLREATLDHAYLAGIIKRHGLEKLWGKVKK